MTAAASSSFSSQQKSREMEDHRKEIDNVRRELKDGTGHLKSTVQKR